MNQPSLTTTCNNALPEQDSPEQTNTPSLMEGSSLLSDPQQLLKLAKYKMPFGKYKGQHLIDLPEPYVVWFANKGFPKGELGVMLSIVYEVKVNGLEYLFKPLRQ